VSTAANGKAKLGEENKKQKARAAGTIIGKDWKIIHLGDAAALGILDCKYRTSLWIQGQSIKGE
jgi:hypothetical protein